MSDPKSVSTPLATHFKLSKEQSLTTEEERDHIDKMSYTSTVGSLIYAIVCTRPNIVHVVGVVRKYMSNPGKQH